MPNNIPPTAISVMYEYGSLKGLFHVWPVKGGKWQWDARGNNGEENTREEAIRAARVWIQFDIK